MKELTAEQEDYLEEHARERDRAKSFGFLAHLSICFSCDDAQVEDDCIKCLAGKKSFPEECPKGKW
jgi:hypothetical protein